MLVAPEHVSLAASVVPSTIVAWAAQGPDDSNKTHTVYASFVAAGAYFVGELLHEMALGEYGWYINFAVILKQYCHMQWQRLRKPKMYGISDRSNFMISQYCGDYWILPHIS